MPNLNKQAVLSLLNRAYPRATFLLRHDWWKLNINSGIPCTGFCYIAAEVAYHMLGGKQEGFQVWFARVPDWFVLPNAQTRIVKMTHWWLEDKDGFFDPTAKQFTQGMLGIVYANGRRGGFLTRDISKRAAMLRDIALENA